MRKIPKVLPVEMVTLMNCPNLFHNCLYSSIKMFTNKAQKSNSLANNTQMKFKNQLMAGNSFESASGLLRKTGSQLKQTKLSVCQKQNKLIFSGFVDEPFKLKPKQEFVYMPAVKDLKQNTATIAAANTVEKQVTETVALPTTSKMGRDLISLVGRVDFCIKMHRMQPNLNAIWNVYGKLLRIIVGKRCEHTLLLRNEEKGPVLQSIFYDFEGELKFIKKGCYVHVVGRFSGENRLNTFSVEQVSNADWQQDFTRLESLTLYVLKQNNVKNAV